MRDFIPPQCTQIIVHPKPQTCYIAKAEHSHHDTPHFEGGIILDDVFQEIPTYWLAPVSSLQTWKRFPCAQICLVSSISSMTQWAGFLFPYSLGCWVFWKCGWVSLAQASRRPFSPTQGAELQLAQKAHADVCRERFINGLGDSGESCRGRVSKSGLPCFAKQKKAVRLGKQGHLGRGHLSAKLCKFYSLPIDNIGLLFVFIVCIVPLLLQVMVTQWSRNEKEEMTKCIIWTFLDSLGQKWP